LFGTDAPVVPQDAIEALHCAFRRTYRDNSEFFPENRVSLETAVDAFSTHAQISLRGLTAVPSSGAVAPGEEADFVVFEKDPFESVQKRISENPVRFLMIRGQVVEAHASFAKE